MTPTQTPTDRQNEAAKRHVNAMLRSGARGETLALAWRALAETVRGEQAAKTNAQ